MRKLLLRLSIGNRLKVSLIVFFSIVILLLGVYIYVGQHRILLNQAKQNSFASIDDLIRYTQNEIDASVDKIEYFNNAALDHFNGLGKIRKRNGEFVSYKASIINSSGGIDRDTLIKVPVLYKGKVKLQNDTTIMSELRSYGINYFIYYQKVGDYFIEILNTGNQENLNNFETNAILDSVDWSEWSLQSDDALFTHSAWIKGNPGRWVQGARTFVWDGDEIVGAVVAAIAERNEDRLRETFNEKVFYESGVCYQVNEVGLRNFHPRVPDGYIDDEPHCQRIIEEEKTENTFFSMKDSTGTEMYYFYKYYPTTYNNIVIEVPASEVLAPLSSLENGLILGEIVSVLLMILLVNWIVKTITSRLNKAVAMATSIADGDLTRQIDIDSKDELAKLADALNKMSNVLNGTVNGISDTVAYVNKASFELSAISRNISDGANDQAASLEEISASMEEMTSTIEMNTNNAKETEGISRESSENILNSSSVMNESVKHMAAIAEKISFINDIAFQTNILALNAAVEAARAGEHGRGFAVVAAEVRKLAEHSKQAADEIGVVSGKGMKIAQEAGDKLSEHVPMVQKTAELVQNIATASVEQTAGIEQINDAIQGLNTITQQNASEASHIVESIQGLSENSKSLNELIRFFKTKA